MADGLERQLEALARQIPCPPAHPFADQVLGRISAPSVADGRRDRRRIPWLPAVAALTVAGLVVLPGPRGAVARWLGFDSVRIEPGPLPASVTAAEPTTSVVAPTGPTPEATIEIDHGLLADLGPAVSAAEAARVSGLPLELPAAIGEPRSIHVVDIRGVVQVIAVYPPGPSLPASPVTGVGALVSVLAAHIEEGYLGKFVADGTTIDAFMIGDDPAVWLEGAPHQVVVVADTEPVVDTLRLATNTLLWQHGEVVVRLEATINRDEAVRLVESSEPIGG